MPPGNLLIYGANGYTGRIILTLLGHYQVTPVIAGRNQQELSSLAAAHHLSYKIAALDEKEELYNLLKNTTVVLHVAGPFRHTARQMIEACIQTKTHYMDITGEIEVFEMARQYNDAAKAAGIMLLPGAGFDVVPTDCMALHLKNKLPDASRLKLAFASHGGSVSHGTAMTMVEGLGKGGAIREGGKIRRKPLGHKGREVDFGLKKLFTLTIPWGDVSTAYYTTGIPDIEVYTAVSPSVYWLLKFQFLFNWLLRSRFLKSWLKGKVKKRASGPSEETRKKSKSLVWGQVENAAGNSISATLETPDGYTLTAHSSLIIAKKILSGNFKPGYQTPASAYGEDLVLEVPGVSRVD
jgi:short subunit dehydrogenase-like uncharacterized protein